MFMLMILVGVGGPCLSLPFCCRRRRSTLLSSQCYATHRVACDVSVQVRSVGLCWYLITAACKPTAVQPRCLLWLLCACVG
jgi:hypothetical protein